ncbi:hypothetical protein [Pseudomonas fluorescens]|uniref:Uncharacterized protein n=1 Tax=Pseudomonas fluorescens TaxID=294 RepID=A0A5E7CTX0_PSEFL|nr:hypothetical protein [Pseudomonas fluorescens]VVO08463.1 hypothetical protein PS710_03249 [Pseudomonas fluorescens]
MTQILVDDNAVLAKLQAGEWWQGSLIHSSCIANLAQKHPECEWWVVASQACNIYSCDFHSIPVVELVGATAITKLTEYSSGFHPREIDLAANGESGELLIKAESQKRLWIPRSLLIEIEAPKFRLENIRTQPFTNQTLWLDKFSSWLARGYTRVALPDEFNLTLAKSKIREILETRLAKKKHDDLYGIFMTISADEQNETKGELGVLKPPYDLGILIACYENIDPQTILEQLAKQLFKDEIKDPKCKDGSLTITRAALAKRLGVRIIEADIDVRSISNINLSELLGPNTVRYTMVDYHSDSTESGT